MMPVDNNYIIIMLILLTIIYTIQYPTTTIYILYTIHYTIYRSTQKYNTNFKQQIIIITIIIMNQQHQSQTITIKEQQQQLTISASLFNNKQHVRILENIQQRLPSLIMLLYIDKQQNYIQNSNNNSNDNSNDKIPIRLHIDNLIQNLGEIFQIYTRSSIVNKKLNNYQNNNINNQQQQLKNMVANVSELYQKIKERILNVCRQLLDQNQIKSSTSDQQLLESQGSNINDNNKNNNNQYQQLDAIIRRLRSDYIKIVKYKYHPLYNNNNTSNNIYNDDNSMKQNKQQQYTIYNKPIQQQQQQQLDDITVNKQYNKNFLQQITTYLHKIKQLHQLQLHQNKSVNKKQQEELTTCKLQIINLMNKNQQMLEDLCQLEDQVRKYRLRDQKQKERNIQIECAREREILMGSGNKGSMVKEQFIQEINYLKEQIDQLRDNMDGNSLGNIIISIKQLINANSNGSNNGSNDGNNNGKNTSNNGKSNNTNNNNNNSNNNNNNNDTIIKIFQLLLHRNQYLNRKLMLINQNNNTTNNNNKIQKILNRNYSLRDTCQQLQLYENTTIPNTIDNKTVDIYNTANKSKEKIISEFYCQ